MTLTKWGVSRHLESSILLPTKLTELDDEVVVVVVVVIGGLLVLVYAVLVVLD